jgi:hypothetical protein
MDLTSFLLKKKVDWSVLQEGVTIPVSLQQFLADGIARKMPRGSAFDMKLMLDGVKYDVMLKNIKFDQEKYPDHKDLVQLRWSRSSPLALHLQQKFSSSFSLIRAQKASIPSHTPVRLDDSQLEYLVLYLTANPSVIAAECITNADCAAAKDSILRLDEIDIEQLLGREDIGSIGASSQLAKYRKLDRTFGEELKKVYGYRCQICGLPIGTEYGAKVSNTHHIEYFSRSLDNSPDNLLIVCPNHHSIIHATDPVFEKKTASFKYPNGYEEKLKLNVHLIA